MTSKSNLTDALLGLVGKGVFSSEGILMAFALGMTANAPVETALPCAVGALGVGLLAIGRGIGRVQRNRDREADHQAKLDAAATAVEVADRRADLAETSLARTLSAQLTDNSVGAAAERSFGTRAPQSA